jgi:hypothetical protein
VGPARLKYRCTHPWRMRNVVAAIIFLGLLVIAGCNWGEEKRG